ncbi:MAG: hypothetical protein WD407_09840 [Rhodospirillales bacterium]
MVTLTAIADSPNTAITNQQADTSSRVTDQLDLSRGALALIERSRSVPIRLELPVLGRNGNTTTTTASVLLEGQATPTEFVLKFEKLRAGLIRVDISNVEAGINRTASFDIYLNQNGKIDGYDVRGRGRIDTSEPPNLAFLGNGPIFQFVFDDAKLGPLHYSQFSFSSEILELLQGTRVSSATGTINGDPFQGTSGDNVITGTAEGEIINGFAGNDIIDGGGGDDTIDGGDDDDTLTGGAGNDVIDGGAGTDTVDYSGDAAGVVVDLQAGTATDGAGDTDTLSNIENVIGSGFNDTITGSTEANTLDGGAGDDTISGGAGNDTLTGGAGNDTFIIQDGTGDEVITDFVAGTNTDDVIDLSGVASLNSFVDVFFATTDSGDGAVIDLGGGSTLTLQGVSRSDLKSSDFIF